MTSKWYHLSDDIPCETHDSEQCLRGKETGRGEECCPTRDGAEGPSHQGWGGGGAGLA